MDPRISGYYKTEHFMYRQWQREVPDEILKAVLPAEISTGKKLLVISNKILRKYSREHKTELLIKTDGNTLISCWYCDFNEYFFNGKKKENYYFINQFNYNQGLF